MPHRTVSVLRCVEGHGNFCNWESSGTTSPGCRTPFGGRWTRWAGRGSALCERRLCGPPRRPGTHRNGGRYSQFLYYSRNGVHGFGSYSPADSAETGRDKTRPVLQVFCLPCEVPDPTSEVPGDLLGCLETRTESAGHLGSCSGWWDRVGSNTGLTPYSLSPDSRWT